MPFGGLLSLPLTPFSSNRTIGDIKALRRADDEFDIYILSNAAALQRACKRQLMWCPELKKTGDRTAGAQARAT